MDGNQSTPWCTLESYTKFCKCGTCTPEHTREIAALEFTPKQIHDLYLIATNPETQPGDRADAIYLFVNKCVTQRRPISRDEAHTITSYMAQTMAFFVTPGDIYWMIKVLLDMYEHDQHILDFPVVHVLVTFALHVVTTYKDTGDLDVLINTMSAVVTLTSGLFCYGFNDEDLQTLDLPIEIERPADAKSLECIFEMSTFCQGIVHLLLYATTMFDKWYERESLFHWDLAIIATVVKARLLRYSDLCAMFDKTVIEKLFDVSADYTSLVVLAKTRPLPWKRPVLECCSLVLTGSPSYLLGIALIDQTSGARRFGLFLHAILKHYHTIEALREACTNSPVVSPEPVTRAVAMLMSLSGRDHSHISRMMRRLRQHVEPLAQTRTEPTVVDHIIAPQQKEMTDEERNKFFEDIIREESESRKKSSTSSSTSSKKKKKKKKKGSQRKTVKAQVDCAAEDESSSSATDDDEQKDDEILPPDPVVMLHPEPLPFGSTSLKRKSPRHKRRRPIKPLLQPIPESLNHEREPVQEPEREPQSEPEREPEREPEPEPEQEREREPEREPQPEPEQEPEREPQSEPEREPELFKYVFQWSKPIRVNFEHKPYGFEPRTISHPMDVLRWTPLVYAYSVRRSFEQSVGVESSFCS